MLTTDGWTTDTCILQAFTFELKMGMYIDIKIGNNYTCMYTKYLFHLHFCIDLTIIYICFDFDNILFGISL